MKKLSLAIALVLTLTLVSAKPAYATFDFNPCTVFPWLSQCHKDNDEDEPTPTMTPTPTTYQEPTPTATEEATPTPTNTPNVESYQGANTTVTCDTSVSGHENYDCPKTSDPQPIEGPRTPSSGPEGQELPNTGPNTTVFLGAGFGLFLIGLSLFLHARRRLATLKTK